MDELLNALTPGQFDEWAAFERVEGESHERLHSQLAAIGGAVLHELQVISYYLAAFVTSGEDRNGLKPPRTPKPSALDPLAPSGRYRTGKTSRVSEEDETGFVSPTVAVSLLRSSLRG